MSFEDLVKKKFKTGKSQQFHIEGDVWLVPCMANYMKNEFNPLVKPLSVEISPEKKGNKHWTPVEDEILLKIVTSRGQKAWSSIARELNALIHNNKSVREGRNCRERWLNHVNPELKKGEWTQEEDDFIVAQHALLGNRWSDISRKMQGRTENSVKNRFYSLTKKNKTECDDREQEIGEKKIEVDGKNEEDLSLLLFSPQLFNLGYLGSPSVSGKNEFLQHVPVIMRSIATKTPSFDKIADTKSKLFSEILENTSPSSFFW